MKKYLILFNMLFITATMYFGVKAFYKTAETQLDHDPLAKSVSQSVISSEDETRHPASHYKSVTERNLFNTKEKEADDKADEKPKEEDKEPEETKLELKLWGTVSGAKNRTYAVIEDKKAKKKQQGKQNLYREGDMIQNAIVKRIEREQVILTVNDKDEVLKMEEKKSSSKSSRGREERDEKPRAERRKRGSSQNIKLARSQIDEAISDVNNLMKQARIRPHFKDGKPDGLTLTSIKPKSIFRKLGLRSGDIIMGVDGSAIESVDDALKFYNSLKSSPNVALEIKRRGKMKTMAYEIEE